MFDSETRWFIRCDTCPEDRRFGVATSGAADSKELAEHRARQFTWDIRDDLHRCPQCVREGRGLARLGGTETAR